MVTDRVGDFIIRLQNAARIGKVSVSVPYSSHLLAIAKKLKQVGFIESVETLSIGDDGVKKTLTIALALDGAGRPRLRGVKRVSKPGRRLYLTHTEAHRVKGGTGVRILSSSAGIMSDAEARKARVGGEDLFEVW